MEIIQGHAHAHEQTEGVGDGNDVVVQIVHHSILGGEVCVVDGQQLLIHVVHEHLGVEFGKIQDPGLVQKTHTVNADQRLPEDQVRDQMV